MVKLAYSFAAKLDRMIQQYATQRRSYISGLPAECGHHHIGRSNTLLRWDINNIIPLTLAEHRAVHDGTLKYKINNPFREVYLESRRNRNIKDYLLEKGMTFEEFALRKKEELENVKN